MRSTIAYLKSKIEGLRKENEAVFQAQEALAVLDSAGTRISSHALSAIQKDLFDVQSYIANEIAGYQKLIDRYSEGN